MTPEQKKEVETMIDLAIKRHEQHNSVWGIVIMVFIFLMMVVL